MVVREDGPGQVIKITATGVAMIALSFSLAQVHPAAFDVLRVAPDASEAFRPAHLTDSFVALCIVYQVVDLEHAGSMLDSISLSKTKGCGLRCQLPDLPIEPIRYCLSRRFRLRRAYQRRILSLYSGFVREVSVRRKRLLATKTISPQRGVAL
jgi:hypothetical protein